MRTILRSLETSPTLLELKFYAVYCGSFPNLMWDSYTLIFALQRKISSSNHIRRM